MKKSLIILLLLSSFSSVFAQDYVEAISIEACECLKDIPLDLTEDERNMKLGLCMIQASMPYKKKLKKDHKINLDDLGGDGDDATRLGQLIAIQMFTTCPDTFLKLTQGDDDDSAEEAEEAIEEAAESKTTKGEVTDITTDLFVVYSIKETSGKTTKYYWLDFVKSEIDLPSSYNMLLGKAVVINYDEKEFFDPKIKEYKIIRVITSIEVQ